MRPIRPCVAQSSPFRGPSRNLRRLLPSTPFVRVVRPAPQRIGLSRLGFEALAPGQKLALWCDVPAKRISGDRDNVMLRRGTEFVVLEPPDDDHPDACLVEAVGVVWGWIPLSYLARLPCRGAS